VLTGGQLVEHQRADYSDDDDVENGARAHQLVDRLLAARAALDVFIGVVGDQPGRPVNLGHHRVAGVDAQAALDAAQLRALADVDADRTDRDALHAVDAVARRLACGARARGVLDRQARLAAVAAVGDVERVDVGQRRLDARPRAHVEAHLLAHVAGEIIGGEGEDADPHIGGQRRLEGEEIGDQRRRVGEVEREDAAGAGRDQQPQAVLGDAFADLRGAPRRGVELDAIAPVSLDQPLDPQEEIGPHRLDAEVAAPDATEQRVGEEQRERGEDQDAGEIVDFLRPDLDEEPIEARMRQVDQDRLARLVRTAVPTHERKDIVEAEADDQYRPLQAAVVSADLLRVDLRRGRIERALVVDFGPSVSLVFFRCAHSPAPRL